VKQKPFSSQHTQDFVTDYLISSYLSHLSCFYLFFSSPFHTLPYFTLLHCTSFSSLPLPHSSVTVLTLSLHYLYTTLPLHHSPSTPLSLYTTLPLHHSPSTLPLHHSPSTLLSLCTTLPLLYSPSTLHTHHYSLRYSISYLLHSLPLFLSH
jgi:hypothetical protein